MEEQEIGTVTKPEYPTEANEELERKREWKATQKEL